MDAAVRVTEVKASRGAGWLVDSFALFRQKPAAWIGLSMGWLVITLGLILVPLVGGVIANLLQPVFFASFAVTAYRQSRGESIAMGDLFIGFKHNVRSLVNLGMLLLVAEIAIFAVMWALGLPMAPAESKTFTMGAYVELLKGKEWILALGFVLTVVVKGGLWFAPPLIAFHGMRTAHAIRWSVYAALANVGAMIVYGLALMALFFVALMPWALGLLIVIPLMVISTFVGYREVFEPEPATAESPAA